MSTMRVVKGVEVWLVPAAEDSASVTVECFICGKGIPPERRCWRGRGENGHTFAHLLCGERYADPREMSL